jgi:hypothetical protein
MDWVVVGGRLVLRQGMATGELPGTVLNPSALTSTGGVTV